LQNVDERSAKRGHERMMERVAVFREAFANDKDDRSVSTIYVVMTFGSWHFTEMRDRKLCLY